MTTFKEPAKTSEPAQFLAPVQIVIKEMAENEESGPWLFYDYGLQFGDEVTFLARGLSGSVDFDEGKSPFDRESFPLEEGVPIPATVQVQPHRKTYYPFTFTPGGPLSKELNPTHYQLMVAPLSVGSRVGDLAFVFQWFEPTSTESDTVLEISLGRVAPTDELAEITNNAGCEVLLSYGTAPGSMDRSMPLEKGQHVLLPKDFPGLYQSKKYYLSVSYEDCQPGGTRHITVITDGPDDPNGLSRETR